MIADNLSSHTEKILFAKTCKMESNLNMAVSWSPIYHGMLVQTLRINAFTLEAGLSHDLEQY